MATGHRPELAYTEAAELGLDHAIVDTRAEIDRTRRVKPPFPTNPLRALRILVEEAGEVALAAGVVVNNTEVSAAIQQDLRDELIQVASVAIQWAAVIGRR